MKINKELLNILACPRCRSELSLAEENNIPLGLICASCAVVYPIKDNIPVMLIKDAIPLEKWQDNKVDGLK